MPCYTFLAQEEMRYQVVKRVHATMRIHTELDVLPQEEKPRKADHDLQIAKRIHTTKHARVDFNLLVQQEKRFQVAKSVHSTMHSHN